MSPPRAKSALPDLGIWILLALAVFMVDGDLLGGRLIDSDRVLTETWPLLSYVSETLRGGRLVDLGEQNFLGHDLAALPAAQATYPPTLLLGQLADPVRALGLAIFLHHALLLIGAYALARTFGLGRGVSVLVAIAAGFSGGIVGRLDDLPALCTLSYLPLLMALARSGAGGPAVPARAATEVVTGGLLSGLTLTAGDLPTAGVVIATWLATAALRRTAADGAAALSAVAGRLRAPLLGLALGLGLAAAALFPRLAAVPTAPPAGIAPLAMERIGLAHLPTVLFPFIHGGGHRVPGAGPAGTPPRPATAGGPSTTLSWVAGPPLPHFGVGSFGPGILYPGSVPLVVLLLVGLDAARRARSGAGVGGLVSTAAVAFVLALGPTGPLAPLWWIPGLSAVRPSLWIVLFDLAVALLSGLALEAHLAVDHGPSPGTRMRRTTTTGIAGLTLVFCGLCWLGWYAPQAMKGEPVAVRKGVHLSRGSPELSPDHLRADAVERLRASLRGAVTWGAWIGLVAIAARRLLVLHADGILAAGPLVVYLAALAFADGGLVFARRAWGRTGPASLQFFEPIPVTQLKTIGSGARTLVHAPAAAFGPIAGLPHRDLAGPFDFRTGFANLLDGLTVVGGPDRFVPEPLVRYFGRWPPDPVEDHAKLSMAGVSAVISAVPLRHEALVPDLPDHAMRPPMLLYRLRHVEPRVLVVRPLAPLSSGAQPGPVLDLLRRRMPATLVTDPARGPLVCAKVLAPGESVVPQGAPPGRTRATAVLRRPGFAVFGFTHGPGWTARLNGRPVPVLDAGGLCAVALEAGQTEVILTWEPGGTVAGRTVSLVTLVVTVLGAMAVATGLWPGPGGATRA